jgi:hypothetical protein
MKPKRKKNPQSDRKAWYISLSSQWKKFSVWQEGLGPVILLCFAIKPIEESSVWQEGLGPVSLLCLAIKPKEQKSSVWQEGLGPVSLLCLTIKPYEKNILCLTRRSRAHQPVVFRYQANGKKSSVWQEGPGPVRLLCFVIKSKEKKICLTGRSRALEAVVFRYQVTLEWDTQVCTQYGTGNATASHSKKPDKSASNSCLFATI